MDYKKTGNKIRYIREKELHKTRQEISEEIDVSIDSINRLENANKEIKNIEVFEKFANLSGYTLDELVYNKEILKINERFIRRINYVLIGMSIEELEFVLNSLNQFVKYEHKDKLRTLKDIKEDIKNNNEQKNKE